MDIGERIKSTRTRMKLTQEELAIKAGFKNRSAISKLETAGNDITMRQIKKIASALDVSAPYLMGWEIEIERKESESDALKRYYSYITNIMFCEYVEKLWRLPEESKQNIYRQIRFEEEEVNRNKK